MNVLCCYTRRSSAFHSGLDARTEEFIKSVNGKFVETIGTWGYFDALDAEWRKGHGFINVEHDILPTKEQLEAMWECPQDWCVHRYVIMGNDNDYAFGCVKFSAKMCQSHPDVLGRGRTGWESLDRNLSWVLRDVGYSAHVHEGTVRHFNPTHVGIHNV